MKAMYVYFLIGINFCRFKMKKIISRCKINVNKIQRVALSTKVKILKQGELNLGYNTCISEKGSIFIGENGSLTIKDRTYFNKCVFISCQNKIIIEENCLFGPDVKIIDNNHKFTKENGVSTTEHSFGEIYIGENSWIGANVVLLKNAHIGKKCVIGAGCIINEKIPDNSIVTLGSNNIKIEPIKEKCI